MKKILLSVIICTLLIGCNKEEDWESDWKDNRFENTVWESVFGNDSIILFFTVEDYVRKAIYWQWYRKSGGIYEYNTSKSTESCVIQYSPGGNTRFHIYTTSQSSCCDSSGYRETYFFGERYMPFRMENNKLIIKNLADDYKDIEIAFTEKKLIYEVREGYSFFSPEIIYTVYPDKDNVYRICEGTSNKNVIYTLYPRGKDFIIREGSSEKGKIVYTLKIKTYSYFTFYDGQIFEGETDKKIYTMDLDTKYIISGSIYLKIKDSDRNTVYTITSKW